ncbi:ribonuclease HI family protein [Marinilactibacillus kalidii]|uniref:ribonuclease HI family protein n=1 Tax=Marinilactibacillus kalidii TaxID=2820274 RepID=UPI001ABE6BA8|nr:ribonuclease HI family protein [Marinilactibacillus kalidii]
MLKIYSDAAVNGNPGFAGIGIVVSGSDVYKQLKEPLKGQWDNHTAEFEAMSQAITWVVEQGLTDSLTLFFTDSQVVAKSLEKKYVKNDLFKPYLKRCLSLLDQLAYYEIRWIPEKQNKGADQLAKQALQIAIN